MEVLKSHIEEILNTSIFNYHPLSGGDISSVVKLNTPHQSFVLKHGSNINSRKMFEAEAFGLNLIAQTNTIAVPVVINHGVLDGTAFILMEFVDSKTPSPKDYEQLGSQLSELHGHNSESFGLGEDNYIGSLSQLNNKTENWIDFYSTHRLGYQFKLAFKNNLLKPHETPSIDDIKSVLKSFCSDVNPSLLHGDLWSGNYLISKDGIPYLIDPAVYYGHSEIDIAMSKLFGGFSPIFYDAYFDRIPQTENLNERIKLYQLYYLLVHLNLFGSSYYGSVKRIISSYF